MKIYKATKQEQKRLLLSLNKVNCSFINKDLLRSDIEKGQCFAIENNNKIIGMITLLYDEKYGMYYIKRFIITNKKNQNKGYAKPILSSILSFVPTNETVAITPFENNSKMINLVQKLGFEFQYSFLEQFQLYTKIVS